MRINKFGFFERKAKIPKPTGRRKPIWRDWFLVKPRGNSNTGYVSCSNAISFPNEYIGKRIKIKIEIIE